MLLMVSTKNAYGTGRMLEECGKIGLPVKLVTPEEFLEAGFFINPKNYGALYVRWPFAGKSVEAVPKIERLAEAFFELKKPVIDPNVAKGALGAGKWKKYQQLLAAGISIPDTRVLSPEKLTFPVVLKWMYGLKGREVFLVNSESELNECLRRYEPGEIVVQEFLKGDFEYKVVVCGQKSLPVILKCPIKPGGFGISRLAAQTTGNKETLGILNLAEKAASGVGCLLCKVDIMECGGKLYVLEVNRCPGLKSFEEASKYNAFGDFARYLRQVCHKQSVLV